MQATQSFGENLSKMIVNDLKKKFSMYFEGFPLVDEPTRTICYMHIDQSILQDCRSLFHEYQQQHFALSVYRHIKTWKTKLHCFIHIQWFLLVWLHLQYCFYCIENFL